MPVPLITDVPDICVAACGCDGVGDEPLPVPIQESEPSFASTATAIRHRRRNRYDAPIRAMREAHLNGVRISLH